MRAKKPDDPFALFRRWLRDAQNAGELLPEAMALATATRDGRPSVRMVLNRGVSRGGFVFYTNYNSRKAVELIEIPARPSCFTGRGSSGSCAWKVACTN
jgi:pyridoxamine 5'-phosphate oxidase